MSEQLSREDFGRCLERFGSPSLEVVFGAAESLRQNDAAQRADLAAKDVRIAELEGKLRLAGGWEAKHEGLMSAQALAIESLGAEVQRLKQDLEKEQNFRDQHCQEAVTARAESADLRKRLEAAERLVSKFAADWPEVRQLIDGWKTGTPADEWSEWDECVRQKTIALSFELAAIDAARSQTAQPGGEQKDADESNAS